MEFINALITGLPFLISHLFVTLCLLFIGIPLASSLSVSNSILEIIIWGLTAIVLQLLCFKVTDTFLKDLSKRIEDNQLATSILLFSIKISVSLINSAAIIG